MWHEQTPILGLFITLFAYGLFHFIHARLRSVWSNPMILSMVAIPLFLMMSHIPYEQYQTGGSLIGYLIGPATIALAVPVARQIKILKQYKGTILFSAAIGSVTALMGNFALSVWAGLPEALAYAMAPKSITTPMAIGVAQRIGGDPVLTTGMVIFTGTLGMLIARSLLNLFRIDDPLSRGLSIGVAFHAIGIVRAREEGELTGAISSISIALAGVITTLAVPFVSPFFKWLV